MTEKEIFEGLTKLAFQGLEGAPEEDVEHISFCCYMVATRADGSAIGGAFVVDPEVGDISTEELTESGSIPSITTYVLMRQSAPVVNRCITAAVTLKDVTANTDDNAAATHGESIQ
jgi:hypothetical protein